MNALAETSVVRGVIAPVAAAFVTLSLMTWFAARSPAPRPPAPHIVTSGSELIRFVRAFAVMALGGYVVFMVVVLVFSVAIVGDAGAFRSAAWSGAFLIGAAGIVFAAAAALPRRAARR